MTQHSSYWLDDELFTDQPEQDRPDDGFDIQRAARLAAIRRGIANFVSILSGENIPVRFSSGQQSYTDGKEVVIAADEDPRKFDVMVGLALHEGSHVLLTGDMFQYIKRQFENVDRAMSYYQSNVDEADNYFRTILHPALAEFLPPPGDDQMGEEQRRPVRAQYQTTLSRMVSDIKMIMNILEDRRIDQYVFQRAGGYRPYYLALYNRYFFTGEVGRNLRFNPDWRKPTVENYINRLLYMIHPAATADALPGLEALYRLVDMKNIDRVGESGTLWQKSARYDDQPMLWKEANRIYAHILRFAQKANTLDEHFHEFKGTPLDGIPQTMMRPVGMPESLQGLPNLDGEPTNFAPSDVEMDTKGKGKKTTQVPGRYNEKKAKKEIEDAKKVMQGELRKKKLSKQEANAVDALDAADAKLEDISGDGVPFGKCMVTRKLTDQLFEQDWFLFKRWDWRDGGKYNDRAHESITAGKRMGQILHHRLQVRNDPLVSRTTRLQQGGIDRRLLSQLGMDLTSVFYKSRVDSHKPAMLHLTLDASGSMTGRKWDKVRTVAVALAYVGSKLRNVDTVISIRGGNEMPIVAIIFDSRKDQFIKFCQNMRRIEPAGATPEGLCFKATMDIVTEASTTHDVYFINFSDGEPCFGYSRKSTLSGGTRASRKTYDVNRFYYSGDVAYKHTRRMVQTMKEHGVKVLSYFISEGNSYYDENPNVHYGPRAAFRTMYGESAEFVNVRNATEVLRTLNKYLVKRGT